MLLQAHTKCFEYRTSTSPFFSVLLTVHVYGLQTCIANFTKVDVNQVHTFLMKQALLNLSACWCLACILIPVPCAAVLSPCRVFLLQVLITSVTASTTGRRLFSTSVQVALSTTRTSF